MTAPSEKFTRAPDLCIRFLSLYSHRCVGEPAKSATDPSTNVFGGKSLVGPQLTTGASKAQEVLSYPHLVWRRTILSVRPRRTSSMAAPSPPLLFKELLTFCQFLRLLRCGLNRFSWCFLMWFWRLIVSFVTSSYKTKMNYYV